MERRSFLFGAAGLAIARKANADDIIGELSREAMRIVRAIQQNGGMRGEHARRLASVLRLATVVDLDGRLLRFYRQLRQDEALRARVLDTQGLSDPILRQLLRLGIADVGIVNTREQREQALSSVLTNGVLRHLLSVAGHCERGGESLALGAQHGYLFHKYRRVADGDSTCLVLAIDTAVFSLMATGLGYLGTGASVFFVGAAAPEAVLIFAVLAISATLIGKIAC